jgi:fructosamine-3-kinase
MTSPPLSPLPVPARPWPAGDGLFLVQLADGRSAWLKQHAERPGSYLAAEAAGLERLRSADGLRVPRILGMQEHRLLLEDLGRGRPVEDFADRAGIGLAIQHGVTGPSYGLDRDGWCGDGFQDNTTDPDGHRFFAERRLMVQARRAHDSGRLDTTGLDAVQRICARLPDWIPEQPPSLLHGDLWMGNLHCCADGRPALIDAGAVHFGWAEADLAMLVLFGDPGPRLFDAYAGHAALHADWRERAPLYNLYHLLNHLNLFGSGYLGAVRAVLKRFAPAP